MSKEKQIEEMAHLVCEMAYKPNSCQECAGRKGGCFTLPKMKILHDHGYRKQSEGEWIKLVKIRSKEGEPVLHSYKCSLCGVYLAKQANYCPNCGAKMTSAQYVFNEGGFESKALKGGAE